MKQNITLLFIALLSMVAGSAWAYDAEIDNICYTFHGDEAEVSGMSFTFKGKLDIPASITFEGKKYKVTTIKAAFIAYSSSITSVVIPNTVRTIGKSAFRDCYSLNSVIMPNSVTSIGESAFDGCSNLTSVELPNNITKIEYRTFANCGLTSITIPNSVVSIGNSAFASSKLKTVKFGNSVESIGKSAFSFCNDLKSLSIPKSVKEINEYAFRGCYKLSYISFENSIPTIGGDAFDIYNSMENTKVDVNITDLAAWCKISFNNEKANPLMHGGKLLLNGEELKNLEIPNTVTEIKDYAFIGINICSVTIPSSVTKIGAGAFAGDTIQSLTIGSGVIETGSVQKSSYSSNSGLIKKVIWLTNTPPKGYEKAKGLVNYVSNNLYNSWGYGTQPKVYVYPLLSSMFAIDGVKYVPLSMADRTCEAIDAVYDESASLTKLGTDVTFRNVKFKVNYVRPYTCSGNSFVKKVELGEGLPFIEDHVFDGCTNMQSVKLAESVAWLGVSSFKNCASLKEIAIPAATTEVRHNAFKGCTSLQNVTMNNGSGTLTLHYNFDDKTYDQPFDFMTNAPLFEDCPLDKVYIGRNIAYGTTKNEGYSPFYRNTSLRKVEITDRETEVGENEFYGCTGLKSVKIGNGVTTFGNWAFSGCSSLDYFEFGSSVKTIGTEAFSDCSKVTRIISHAATPPACGSQAMDDINKWDCTLIVPDGSTAAYQQASQWKEFLFVEDLSAGIELPTTDAAANEPVYTLSGQRLKAPRKGINIVGGRKVVVK